MIIFILIVAMFGCSKSDEKANQNTKQIKVTASTPKEPAIQPGDPMTKPLPNSGFKAKIEPQVSQLTIKSGETTTVPVKVTNMGDSRWSSANKDGVWGKLTVAFAYHVLDNKGKVVVSDGKRTALPDNVMPNQAVLLNANVEAPAAAGTYTYVFDMVQEGVSWFEGKGSAVSKINVTVN
jgi:hypothetical protein